MSTVSDHSEMVSGLFRCSYRQIEIDCYNNSLGNDGICPTIGQY